MRNGADTISWTSYWMNLITRKIPNFHRRKDTTASVVSGQKMRMSQCRCYQYERGSGQAA